MRCHLHHHYVKDLFSYRYRTMAKTLTCDYTLDLPNFEHISHHGKDFISKLLVLDPKVGPSPVLSCSPVLLCDYIYLE